MSVKEIAAWIYCRSQSFPLQSLPVGYPRYAPLSAESQVSGHGPGLTRNQVILTHMLLIKILKCSNSVAVGRIMLTKLGNGEAAKVGGPDRQSECG